MHQEVLQEMEQMQQARENEIADCRAKMNKAFDREMDRIQAEREEIEKEKSDIALGQDFLEKNEAELLEHMEEETKTEQEEMNDLIVKQNATRAEIQELTQKLELLNSKDKELTRNINMLQKKINAIVKQFDDKASEASREKRELERRQLYIQRRTQDLERQEAGVQKTAHQAEAAQKEVQEEIKNIILQRDRLEQVRKLFEVERVTLQKLRLEEEAFREKEAGWNMRASSLMEELKGHEAKIEALTSRSSADQKAISDLQLALEATQKRMGTIESLKALSVQRRDFKQASRCSSELAKCRDTIGQQQAELEKLTIRISEPGVQEQLEALRQEYEKARTHARNEESNLSKEIQEATADILSRLDAFATVSSTAGSEDKQLKKDGDVVATTDGCNSAEHSTAAADPRVAAPAAMGQLSQLVLDELRREIKDLQELSRIRFGREEVVLVSAFLVQPANHPTTSTDTPEENSAASTAVTAVIENTETKKLALERDIQAAVAEESYEAAAELQAQLDAL
ncbi:hypothetical protein BCR41DRAFT_371935 [Lobosporangium transversale]|uniref:Uncharacterized protein n=1 Tax=Lobosporangium transversale TaxID=64571 RepID=A0A1Y2GKC9_9FUNG|nr:hypothetical protein BCR41DRAFT_371935 [Lobosporangium transversale]ORZ12117.1 hypothetical protein BCR41DRAFT_371935 [Lobosporangium transversale]|eukprot:XP_021879982.1 hypothetical protein BCR41DRAFT_371935 [Lobosporangium transversale]